MTGTRYPVKRDTADMLAHPDQGLTEQERQQEIRDMQDSGTSGGGGFTPSWAAYSTTVAWVQDPGDADTFWMALNHISGHDVGDSADGWTTEDHRSTGSQTLLVPPAAGAYAFGASFGYTVVGTTPFDISVDHGPAVIYKSGGSYGVEYHIDRTPRTIRGYTGGVIADALSGFAPTIQSPSSDEYGFAVYTHLSVGFTPGSGDVHKAGWAALLWAHKVA